MVGSLAYALVGALSGVQDPPMATIADRRPGDGLVRRTELIERLAVSHEHPLALLVAPAGYGKTTLLDPVGRR